MLIPFSIVDDVLKPWTWNKSFSLVHLRFLLGAFSVQEWKRLYKQIYNNLAPGAWIEQLEIGLPILCDDGTMPADSQLAKMHSVIEPAGYAANKPLNVYDDFQSWIEEAGFINVHKTDYKVPIGDWPKLQVYKDSGRVSLKQFKTGLEGWMLWFLTKYGQPEPWTPEQVQVWLALMRRFVYSVRRVHEHVLMNCKGSLTRTGISTKKPSACGLRSRLRRRYNDTASLTPLVEGWFETLERREKAVVMGTQNELASNTKLSIDKRPSSSSSVVMLRFPGEDEVNMK